MPTDDRFKKLTRNQKCLLFEGWTELPSSDQIKVWYDKQDHTEITESDEVDFKELGYTPKQIEKMKEQLRNAGYNQSD